LRGGEGSLTVTGGATIEPRFQARLQAKAERFRVLARVDRSITASGNAELTLGPDQGRLDGTRDAGRRLLRRQPERRALAGQRRDHSAG
jgi:autotransporter translocation and assembly factor TamB